MAQVQLLSPPENFVILHEWLLFMDEYVANTEHAAEASLGVAQAKTAYLRHHEEDHMDGSLRTKWEIVKWVIFFRDEALKIAQETRRKMLALKDLDALREDIAWVVES